MEPDTDRPIPGSRPETGSPVAVRSAARYCAELPGLAALLVLAALAVRAVAAGGQPPSAGASPVVATVLVAAASEAAAYGLVFFGARRNPAAFLGWWSASLVVKFAVFGIFAAAVMARHPPERDFLLLAWMGAFTVLSIHQVLRLIPLSSEIRAFPAMDSTAKRG